MFLPDEVLSSTQARLHRVIGQLQGIDRMILDQRECRDIVRQISAANKALEQAAFQLVAAGLTYCVENPAEAEAGGYSVQSVQKMFMQLS